MSICKNSPNKITANTVIVHNLENNYLKVPADVLGAQSNITNLLIGNIITDDNSAATLTEILKSNTSIENIRVRKCDNEIILASIKHIKNLKVVIMSPYFPKCTTFSRVKN